MYEVNGVDSTDLINFIGDEKYKNVSITKNVSTLSVSYEGFKGNSGHFEESNSFVVFNSDMIGKKCTLFNGFNYCYRSFLTPENQKTKWKITKLTSKEFILMNSGSNSYIIKLIK